MGGEAQGCGHEERDARERGSAQDGIAGAEQRNTPTYLAGVESDEEAYCSL